MSLRKFVAVESPSGGAKSGGQNFHRWRVKNQGRSTGSRMIGIENETAIFVMYGAGFWAKKLECFQGGDYMADTMGLGKIGITMMWMLIPSVLSKSWSLAQCCRNKDHYGRT